MFTLLTGVATDEAVEEHGHKEASISPARCCDAPSPLASQVACCEARSQQTVVAVVVAAVVTGVVERVIVALIVAAVVVTHLLLTCWLRSSGATNWWVFLIPTILNNDRIVVAH